MSFVVLDTDVASAVFRGRASERLKAAVAGRSVAVTFVTVAELTKWTLVRHWVPTRTVTAAPRRDIASLRVRDNSKAPLKR